MSISTKSLSAIYMGIRYGVTKKTARLWIQKIIEAMASSDNDPMEGNVYVDEFVLGRREKRKVGRSYNAKKKKVITAVELTYEVKVSGMYAIRIEDFSAQLLQYIFINHISRDAKVTTDKWRGYRPISKTYNITQIESNSELNLSCYAQ